jgi:hypothetical protein
MTSEEQGGVRMRRSTTGVLALSCGAVDAAAACAAAFMFATEPAARLVFALLLAGGLVVVWVPVAVAALAFGKAPLTVRLRTSAELLAWVLGVFGVVATVPCALAFLVAHVSLSKGQAGACGLGALVLNAVTYLRLLRTAASADDLQE